MSSWNESLSVHAYCAMWFFSKCHRLVTVSPNSRCRRAWLWSAGGAAAKNKSEKNTKKKGEKNFDRARACSFACEQEKKNRCCLAFTFRDTTPAIHVSIRLYDMDMWMSMWMWMEKKTQSRLRSAGAREKEMRTCWSRYRPVLVQPQPLHTTTHCYPFPYQPYFEQHRQQHHQHHHCHHQPVVSCNVKFHDNST